MKQFINRVKQISILILTISLFGCTSDDASVPEVIAGFTYTLNLLQERLLFLILLKMLEIMFGILEIKQLQ
jgi:hypothetical protein